MIKLVVFDWDGTLMDSEARIVTAMDAALSLVGAPAAPRAEVRNIIGLDLLEAIGRLAPGLAPAARARAAQGYREAYARLHAVPSPLFAGAAETLAALEAAGLMLAIATGKSRRGLDHALEEAGVRHHFLATRCGEESAPKPDPAMLRDLLLELDTAPQDAIMVGDTEFDLIMARAAATRSAAVTYGAHARGRLLGQRPDCIIDDVRELPAALARLDVQPH